MDYINGCFCDLEKGCHPACKEYGMSLENNKLDMNKVKYDWCYDILIRINEIIQSNSSEQDKLHAIAWFTKQGLK